jgi:hypothetical protein
LNYDHKNFNNEASQVTTSNYAIDNYSVGLNGNAFDTLAGGGANTLNLTLVVGRVNLGDLNTQENAALNGINVTEVGGKLRQFPRNIQPGAIPFD